MGWEGCVDANVRTGVAHCVWRAVSLFKAREWWRVTCGEEEEFDRGCMAVANIDNHPDGQGRSLLLYVGEARCCLVGFGLRTDTRRGVMTAKIITGSLHGVLRIFHPRARDFRVEDLLLEQQFDEPILQVEAGVFTSNGGWSLAVLHPRRLVVYTLTAVGTEQQTAYFSLHKNYEHRMNRTVCNMVYGPFGYNNRVDHLCVQSMDGQLTVYEHESLAFSRFLHNFLLPGPLCYADAMDSFITCNSSFEVESYKYQVLASSSGAEVKMEPGHESELTAQKKMQVDWKFVLGEAALDIRVARFSRLVGGNGQDVLVLSEHMLLALSEMGEIRTQIRLDFIPTALTVYQAMEEEHGGAIHNAIVASSTGSTLVYRDAQLVWAARGDQVPLCLCVASFADLHGLVTQLDADGTLAVTYMGTDPPLNVVGGLDGKELNYEEMDDEHRRLLAVIRDATSETKVQPTDKVVLRCQVPSQLDTRGTYDDDRRKGGGVTLRIFCSYEGTGSIDSLQLSVLVHAPLTASETSFTVPYISGGSRTPVIVTVTLYSGSGSLPASNTVTILGSYTAATGEPRTCKSVVTLPLCLFCQVVQPVKNAAYKITLDTNRMPPALTTLFEDLVSVSEIANDHAQRTAANNVLSFMYFSGHDVTILVSKNAGRYRLQSSSFEALWLIAEELCRRLQVYFAGDTGDGPFEVKYEETLPLQDFFMLIDAHFNARGELASKTERMGQRAHQFRSVQKRLLVKFKDKNPQPLLHLDLLLDDTCQQLNALSATIDEAQVLVQRAGDHLGAGCELVLLLMRYRFALDEEAYRVLRSYLSPVVNDSVEQGWEECTEAAMTHLLRTTLSKSSKDAMSITTQLAPLQDTSKLKKQIGVVCERLARGASLTRDQS